MDTPIRLLEEVVDEVEGLRRTDARSYLPEPLLRRAREVLAPHTAVAGSAGTQLRSASDLEGATIAHVFESGLRHGDLLLVTADGSFLALEVDGADNDDASIQVCSSGYSTKVRALADFVFPRDLRRAGLLTDAEAREIDRKESEDKLTLARQRLSQAQSAVAQAEKEVQRLTPKEVADVPPA